MLVRSLGRTAVALAVTAVTAATLATAAVAPAAAAPLTTSPSAAEPEDHTKPAAMPTPEPAASKPAPKPAPGTDAAVPARYRGKVVARTGLLLRDKPTRSSRVVGELEYGEIVRIFCRVEGGDVEGNNRWYLLADGSWAWGSAKYIRSLGDTPHWC
ncbi:SH3 domain-containing protein [Streptomyces sp. GMY02]|uniref:SH3 domain-containing protein n=1 Tax=Streptomyces sp. GMY02 TaxID=1333528 RepID=UPI001C2BA1E4|nr:SH3 domain-containing protein [Streptomyces sp. GMY02]QXE34738.1 SH3 domain-containing protein [Streptomyces sp. GMY02]